MPNDLFRVKWLSSCFFLYIYIGYSVKKRQVRFMCLTSRIKFKLYLIIHPDGAVYLFSLWKCTIDILDGEWVHGSTFNILISTVFFKKLPLLTNKFYQSNCIHYYKLLYVEYFLMILPWTLGSSMSFEFIFNIFLNGI